MGTSSPIASAICLSADTEASNITYYSVEVNEMKALFEPKSVVLIGSSAIKEGVGMTAPQLLEGIAYNMSKFFNGTTLVLDTNGERDCRKLADLPKAPDLSVIMLPPRQSIQQLEESARMGVKVVVIITGGFAKPQREKMRSLRKKYGIRILGPNTIMGVINTVNGLNTTFEKDLMPRRGNISIISQSGGVGACLLDWACFHRIGISKFAFMGDKIDINDVDLLKYFHNDRDTAVICLYMEGVENGRKFVEVARKIVETKPVLVLKGGVTREAALRALSHTGSIAGSDIVFDAALRKAGIIRVENEEELINSAVALAKQPPLRGDDIAIVSNVGGPAILAADAVTRNELKLAILSTRTQKEIESRYPGITAANPIDLIADARADRYSTVLNLVLSDPNVDGVMVINMLKSCFFEPIDAFAVSKTIAENNEKPIVNVAAGVEDFTLIHEVLQNTSIPVYNLPEKAAKALRALRTYSKIIHNS